MIYDQDSCACLFHLKSMIANFPVFLPFNHRGMAMEADILSERGLEFSISRPRPSSHQDVEDVIVVSVLLEQNKSLSEWKWSKSIKISDI